MSMNCKTIKLSLLFAVFIFTILLFISEQSSSQESPDMPSVSSAEEVDATSNSKISYSTTVSHHPTSSSKLPGKCEYIVRNIAANVPFPKIAIEFTVTWPWPTDQCPVEELSTLKCKEAPYSIHGYVNLHRANAICSTQYDSDAGICTYNIVVVRNNDNVPPSPLWLPATMHVYMPNAKGNCTCDPKVDTRYDCEKSN